MANSTIDALPTATSLTGAEWLVCSQTSVTKKTAVSAVRGPVVIDQVDDNTQPTPPVLRVAREDSNQIQIKVSAGNLGRGAPRLIINPQVDHTVAVYRMTPGVYDKDSLPDPAANSGMIAGVFGGAGGKPFVISNGSVWLYADGTTVV